MREAAAILRASCSAGRLRFDLEPEALLVDGAVARAHRRLRRGLSDGRDTLRWPRRAKLPLDRFLSLFADVRGGEGARLLLLAFNVFLILTAYYVMKPVREALILDQPGGAEIKSYAYGAQAVLLRRDRAALRRARGAAAAAAADQHRHRVLHRLPAAVLPGAQSGLRPSASPFFLWIGIFSLMVIAQFWAYANDIYTPEAGKRLFAVIAFGASAGAVFGAWLSGQLIRVLGVHAAAAGRRRRPGAEPDAVQRDRRRGPRSATGAAAGAAGEDVPIGDGNAFALVLRNRYLLLIGADDPAAELGQLRPASTSCRRSSSTPPRRRSPPARSRAGDEGALHRRLLSPTTSRS